MLGARATTARTRSRRGVNNSPPRQMIGKIPPRPLAAGEALHLDARRFGLLVILPGSRGQLLELQAPFDR
jgi:hypothetical protein